MRSVRDGWLWLFGYREVPYAVRGLFRKELGHMMLWGAAWGALNGRYCGFIAAKSLNAPDVLVGVVVSSIAIANLFAVWWGSLVVRRPARRLLIAGIVSLSAIMFSFAGGPLFRMVDGWVGATAFANAGGAWSVSAVVFALQVMLAWIVVQGINTARTRLWRLNYPGSHRARILARFAVWQVLVAVVTTGLIGTYLDGAVHLKLGTLIDVEWDLGWLPQAGSAGAYQLLFPAAGVLALLSAWFYRGMPVRREGEVLEQAQARRREADQAHDTEASYSLPGWFQTLRAGVILGMGEAIRLLKSDGPFRRYMTWQMIAGSGTMMLEVPLILILKERFGVRYAAGAALLTVVPQIVLIVFTPMWAGLFDRWPLLRFRLVHMSAWIASRLMLGVGFWLQSLALVAVGLGLGGLALAGGRFSWQLGHMAFAKSHNDATYMGIHQALTGVRGLFTPFLGAMLYRYVLGWHVVWLTIAAQAVGLYGFARMRKYDEPAMGAVAACTPSSRS
jgi:hypothetical protein